MAPRRRHSLVAAAVALALAPHTAPAQELPVPCAGGNCGNNGPAVWVTQGSANGTVSGGTFRIEQLSDTVSLNWASFDIGSDGRVVFDQPDATAVAVNRIFQNDPSRIFGALEANGQVYLLNQNGILFGETAQITVAGLVASTLDLTPEAVTNGIVGAARQGAPAFAAFVDSNGDPILDGSVIVENGAFLGAEGGQILLFAPEVTNRGRIETPDGQTILAAGSRIYLTASEDPDLRGLIVEVDGDGIATNAGSATEILGEIAAARGNVTMAGFAVNQSGSVSATTSIRQNGSIRLVARRDVTVLANEGQIDLLPSETGTVTIGANSRTTVTLEADDPSTTVDVNVQPESRIDIEGRTIEIRAGAELSATSGDVSLIARSNPLLDPNNFDGDNDGSRIAIESGARIDVSGASVTRSVSDNIIDVELRGNQLADSPLQRDGALRSETVQVDIRQSGVRADGTAWQGTPIADASGEVSNIERNVEERNLEGGRIVLQSQGDVVVARDVVLDVSGGRVDYEGGDVTTSRVLGADGRIYDIADADRDREYVRLVDEFVVEHPRWGVTEVFPGFRTGDGGTFEPGYVEGYDAGSVTLTAPGFIFDGEIRASVVAGRYQRLAPTPVSEAALYRPFDQLPVGGTLIVGAAADATNVSGDPTTPRQFVTGDVRFEDTFVLTGAAADADALDGEFTSTLRPSLIGGGAITQLAVASNGSIVVPAGVDFDLPAASTLQLIASQIDFEATLRSAGGAINLLAAVTRGGGLDPALTLGSNAVLDLSGNWVNDAPELGAATAPLTIDGGSAFIAAPGTLALLDGSQIDVSGGAFRSSEGVIFAGQGGSLSIGALERAGGGATDITLDAALSGFALFDGARLAITANSVCVSTSACADETGLLTLAPSLYIDRGFSDVTLASNQVGLVVDSGSQIFAQQVNYLLPGDTRTVETGTPLSAFAAIGTRPIFERNPVNLTLVNTTTDFGGFDFAAAALRPGLTLAAGSRIDGDPGARLDIRSNALIELAGAVRLPGGDMTVALDATLLDVFGSPAGGLFVSDGAVVDLSGTVVSRIDDRGRRVGTVFNGGRLSLTAARDGIAIASGSRILLDGTNGTLDLLVGPITSPAFVATNVASNGGGLSLTAAEFIIADGEVSARAGSGDGAVGGDLAVTIDGNLRNGNIPESPIGEPLVSLNPRRIVIERDTAPTVVRVGDALSDDLVGEARISEAFIEDGGFANVDLTASNLFSLRLGNLFLAATGEISLGGGVDLDVSGRLLLDTANITGGSGDAALQAGYLALGNGFETSQDIGAALPTQSGVLSVSGDLVDLFGTQRVRGFDTVAIESGGDLRVVGIQYRALALGQAPDNPRSLVGRFVTDADLSVTAGQIYPTTISDYTFEVEGDAGVLDIFGNGLDTTTVLSAGGALRLRATAINQAGVLRAPFGTVDLDGDVVTLADGSITSTSLDGALVPFGAVQGGFDWTFDLANNNETLIYDGVLNEFPEQSVSLNGASVTITEGAVIDVSAGGDLQAYEFIPGIGGSDDFLAADISPGLFAILPGTDAIASPVDPSIPTDGLQVGDAVQLDGIGDLPAGTYTLLPARYALLPGAVLVRPVDGYTDILPGERFAGRDGAVVVSGREINRFDGSVAPRTSGFELLPNTRAFQEAEYQLTSAQGFFADGAQRTPLDAGRVALTASSELNLLGTLRSDAPEGRGAALDIASEVLRIVETASADPIEGVVEIRADELNGFGAESLFLGGARSAGEIGDRLDVIAREVELAEGVTLSAPEVLIAGTESITLGEDATVEGTGAGDAAQALEVVGDAALLRTGGTSLPGVQRSAGSGASSDIEIAASATVSGGGVILDATGDLRLDGSLDLGATFVDDGMGNLVRVSDSDVPAGGALSLSASSVAFGDSPAGTAGLRITSALLDTIGDSDLTITSTNAIDVFGDLTLAAGDRLTLVAPGLQAATTDARLTIAASQIALLGTDRPLTTGAATSGSVSIEGEQLQVAGGLFGFGGFDSVDLRGSDAIVLSGEGTLDASADLVFETPRLLAASTADQTIRAAGDLVITGTAAVTDAGGGAGGLVNLEAGGDLLLATRIEAESGFVTATATGNVTVAPTAIMALAGRSRVFDDVTLSTPGGVLTLASNTATVTIADGAVVDLSSPGGTGGSLGVFAATTAQLGGTLSANGVTGGSLAVDATSIAGATALLAGISDAGFTDRIALRQRGPGDLVLGSGATVTSRELRLQADSGDVTLDGTVSLQGAGARQLLLDAGDDVSITGTVNDLARDEDDSGTTRVALGSASGDIALEASGRLNLGGDAEVSLSVARTNLSRGLSNGIYDPQAGGVRLDGTITGASRITLEGRETYVPVGGVIGSADVAAATGNPWFDDATAFMADADAYATGLGLDGDARFQVLPGIVLESTADLTLAADFNLFDWRFDDAPGVLTLRAAGNLALDNSLSDGFTDPTSTTLTYEGDSWSYRLVAGADLGASSLLSTVRDVTAGNVELAAGTLAGRRTPSVPTAVRTGNGRIDIAAAGDLTLGNQASVIYTSGVATEGVQLSRRGDLGNRLYPDAGGDISITAGRDIVGVASDQLFTSWLFRAGRVRDTNRPLATGWTINFGGFEQNVAALGGGDVTIEAGRDILELSASVPTIGRQVGGTDPEDSIVEVVAGGDLTVRAGRDILGGEYLAGRGTGLLTAGGDMGVGSGGFAPILGIGDTQFTLAARGDLTLQAAVNPTLLPPGEAQQAPTDARSFFSTYGVDSGVSLQSLAGSVRTSGLAPGGDVDLFTERFEAVAFQPNERDVVTLQLAPPRLNAVSFGGDVTLGESFTLFPSAQGTLDVFAERNVTVGNDAGGIVIIQSDADPVGLPSVAAPQGRSLAGRVESILTNIALNPEFNAATPVFAETGGINRLVARTGDIEMRTLELGSVAALYSARPAQLVAGNDIVNFTLLAQNLDNGSVTSLSAGRDIIYTNERQADGSFSLNLRQIAVSGPGFLALRAGRDIDLQTSSGITTNGDISNVALPDGGATISLLAGLGGGEPDYEGFTAAYLEDDLYQQELMAFLERVGAPTDADPVAAFRDLDEPLRAVFIESVLFNELRESGRFAAQPGENFQDFTRGFAALETLFPGANPDLDTDPDNPEVNPYVGDIGLFFSRVYTLDGGGIQLLVPGGEINAGLATPPAAFGIAKQPAELGIVAQGVGDISALSFGDFAVNESRVFAADGGDILVWSTRGDIDAGRGAKTAISAPPPSISIDPETGAVELVFPAALTGSGIQTIATTPGTDPGDVDLYAPDGVVNAGDAGIVAGNLTIAATAVLGADNISFSGVAVGVPTDAPIAPGLADVSAVASSAQQSADATVAPAEDDGESDSPLADAALGFLDVFVLGFGECNPETGENCDEP